MANTPEEQQTITRTICVFSASSDELEPAYYEVAAELGRAIGKREWALVFGGGTRGLMGECARGVHEHGGWVVGVIPMQIDGPGVTYEAADELIVTETLRQRKAEMDEYADAFVALPGGFGTLEEIIEALTLKQLQFHKRPVVFINTNGFYDHLLAFFEHIVGQKFAKEEHRDLYFVANTAEEAMTYIESYGATEFPSKFD